MSLRNYYGRRANVYKVAVVAMRKAWKRMQRGRRENTKVMRRLHNLRISAAAVEHGMRYSEFVANLPKHNVLIDKKIISQLAVTEPKTFQCLVDLARMKQEENLVEQYTKWPDLINKPLTQDELLAQAMNNLSVHKTSSDTANSQTGRETSV